MKLINISRPEIEQVEKEKQEYTLIGVYALKPGLKLFEYNPKKDTVKEVKVLDRQRIEIDIMHGGSFSESESPKHVTVDSRNIYFQALRMESALNRVKAWKEGRKQLFNLQKPKNEINIFQQ